MRSRFRLSAAFLLSQALIAQGTELVANGSFTSTLAPWVMGGGYAVNPGLESGWNTTGMGASDSFGAQPGGQGGTAPYPPVTIEQQVLVVQGTTYEFRCDASGAQPTMPTYSNGDIGTIWVEVDQVEIARLAFGSYAYNGLPGGQVKRAQLCARFQPTTSGYVTLRLSMQRPYLAIWSTPRINIDNVSIRDVVGPTYWIEGNRHLATTLQHRVATAPGALFGVFVAVAENPPGVPFPGIQGLWYLDLPTTTLLGFGTADAAGLGSVAVAVPNDPLFLTTPLWYQAAAVPAGIQFGYDFAVVCTR